MAGMLTGGGSAACAGAAKTSCTGPGANTVADHARIPTLHLRHGLTGKGAKAPTGGLGARGVQQEPVPKSRQPTSRSWWTLPLRWATPPRRPSTRRSWRRPAWSAPSTSELHKPS
eukprot:551998-Pyramimonas_sp.AAC.1